MFKSPVRNHRSKGVKVKQALQICFLLAVCFWLIYQVKHSRDKKQAPDETDANKQTVRTIPSGDILKLGRKDLNPKSEQSALINGKSNEETEDFEETVGEEEDDKIELVTEEEAGDKDDEDGKDGVDELEKSDSEVDREEEEEEKKEKDVEDSGESLKNENNSKEKNVEDETKSSTHESRDENYKADDASSAVTQTSRFIGSETAEVEISKKSTGKDSLADENLASNISGNNVVKEREIAETTKSDPVDIVAQNGNEIAETTTLNAVKNTGSRSSNNEDAASNKENTSETHDSGNVTLDFKKPINKQAEIKSDDKAEAKPDTDVKALTTDDDALNSENGGEVQRDSINSDSATSLVGKDDGTDMEMLANVLNEDSNEEEDAAE